MARLKKGLIDVKLLEVMLVLPAFEYIVIINREKPNVPLYVGNVEEFYWIGKEQDKGKEVCAVKFNRGKKYFEVIVKE